MILSSIAEPGGKASIGARTKRPTRTAPLAANGATPLPNPKDKIGAGAGGKPKATRGVPLQFAQMPHFTHPDSPDPQPQNPPGNLPGLLVLTHELPKPIKIVLLLYSLHALTIKMN